MKRWAAVGLLSAWVLWNQVTTDQVEKCEDGSLVSRSKVEWIVIEGFDTSRECVRQREAILVERQGMGSKEGRKVTREGNMLSERLYGNPTGAAGQLSRYICLPDTIDPRTPKSK